MKMKPCDRDIGENVKPFDGISENSVFVAVAKAAAIFLCQLLLRTHDSNVTIYTETYGKLPVRIKGRDLFDPVELVG